MKKFLALALALVMALALAAPAMAFTNAVEEEDVYALEIALVEYEDNGWFGLLSAAPSDRGYAKNEIVAFIVSFTAEKGAKFDTTDKAYLKVTGNNVSFAVNEVAQATDGQVALALHAADNYLDANIKGMDASKKSQTAKWLAFAKVTGDDASITAEVAVKGAAGTASWDKDEDSISFVDDDENEYVINNATATEFAVSKNDVDLFKITVDAKNKSKELSVYDEDGTEYLVGEDKNGEFQFVLGDTVVENKKVIAALKEIVEDEFEGVFGFDYDLLGGLVNRKYFDGIVDYDKLSVTVDIAPWVAYVQVPDVIVVDPPKTGDATVLVGIVMAIVAAAGVVVFNKVRA